LLLFPSAFREKRGSLRVICVSLLQIPLQMQQKSVGAGSLFAVFSECFCEKTRICGSLREFAADSLQKTAKVGRGGGRAGEQHEKKPASRRVTNRLTTVIPMPGRPSMVGLLRGLRTFLLKIGRQSARTGAAADLSGPAAGLRGGRQHPVRRSTPARSAARAGPPPEQATQTRCRGSDDLSNFL
jgi:hypothetical protein